MLKKDYSYSTGREVSMTCNRYGIELYSTLKTQNQNEQYQVYTKSLATSKTSNTYKTADNNISSGPYEVTLSENMSTVLFQFCL